MCRNKGRRERRDTDMGMLPTKNLLRTPGNILDIRIRMKKSRSNTPTQGCRWTDLALRTLLAAKIRSSGRHHVKIVLNILSRGPDAITPKNRICNVSVIAEVFAGEDQNWFTLYGSSLHCIANSLSLWPRVLCDQKVIKLAQSSSDHESRLGDQVSGEPGRIIDTYLTCFLWF